jgi:DNA-binding IclR family transcriptional regulator
MAGNTSQPGVTVVSRAMALLGAFDAAHRRLSLSDLAERAGIPLATAHRLVGELTRLGALTRRTDGSYVVGRRLWDIGLLAPVQTDLREVASPFLHDLFSSTNVTVHLGVREGLSVLYLERLSGVRSVPVVSRVGAKLPLHATGVGKVLLAHAPAGVQERMLTSLTRITPYTIVQPARMRQQIERTLHDGYATTSEEMALGQCSVAVPVLTEDGACVAALGAVVTSLRRDRPRLVAALQVAAHGIGRSLGTGPADDRRQASAAASQIVR